ncbi:MAG: NAD(P)/FAD-dependent oxidoreductase [Flavobacteriales bacterium]|nr:NAD(P)/FAD-dependent oxidoreductase [Flavobacteriales bacterium]
MIETDLLIIGAGPCGLFTVFEAGLIKLRCHLIDALAEPGGQLTEIYPKKPIYDIPGLPSILAGDLVKNLMEQAAPFKPGFTLGERAETLEKTNDGKWKLVTNKGTEHLAPIVVIAGGLGCFEPRKPNLDLLDKFEDKGVEYIIKDPEIYRGQNVVIAGGGDSALDWTLFLSEVAKSVTLVHRRTTFRGHPDSIQRVMDLASAGKIELLLNSEVTALHGEDHLDKVSITNFEENNTAERNTDHFIPLFGLSPKLGPIKDWQLNLNKESISVNTFDYSTNIPGIYAVGDINDYPGKLRLILCGFHEATLMVQSAFKRIYPEKNLVLKYTTVSGVNSF